ncbi:MAG TPA: 50S ribosomal protein L32e [Candidatus Aenigmarchaeota archaeon]|nr:MAG: 50S ribosomal protein L32e [Candidatus Aenigmarchaeota archaeon]HDD46055.1 50S ribosomal protein L32e [Candidatus Aenigmarchaeota archaeon]
METEALVKRREIKKKKPRFKRQEWHRHKRLEEKWRRPKGNSSKLRKRIKGRGKLPSIGYSSPKEVKGLNRNGFREVIIKNINDLEKIDPSREVGKIASSVGKKKRFEIEEKAIKMGIKIVNGMLKY